MDQVWQSEGLDLNMLYYQCLPTSFRRGLIEVVLESKTTGQIQKENSGVSGAMKVRLSETS